MKMVKAKLNGEFDLILPKHRADRPDWYTETGWEKKRLQSMHQNIGAGDVVYYVGTELGEMAALCSKWGADLVLFEPNHSAWPVIKATWDANKLKPPIYCFAGFASNTTQLQPPKPDMALWDGEGWKLDENGWPKYAQGEIVEAHGFSELSTEYDGLPQTKIDDLVYDGGLEPPTVLTFDCEGSDWEVLKGAERTIRDFKPKIWASIHPEFMVLQYGQYSRDFRNWIVDMGYKETVLAYDHELHCYYEPV